MNVYGIVGGSYSDCQLHIPFVVEQMSQRESRNDILVRDILIVHSDWMESINSIQACCRGCETTMFFCDMFWAGDHTEHALDMLRSRGFIRENLPQSECHF